MEASLTYGNVRLVARRQMRRDISLAYTALVWEVALHAAVEDWYLEVCKSDLRPGSAGTTEVRILFAFDPAREAILLVAGDKAGQWNAWYRSSIPLADARYEEHLTNLKEEQA
jgi:hypothetical protein